MPWAATPAAIEAAPLFWIITVRPDGRPHSTPLVAVWLEGAPVQVFQVTPPRPGPSGMQPFSHTRCTFT